MISMKVPFKHDVFLCQVSYTYNDETFSWKEFSWEVIESSQAPQV
jgi:hypothetical protein